MNGSAPDPSPPAQERPPLFRSVRTVAVVVLLIVSLVWCIATWNNAGRLIFFPMGDVGMGFCSRGGWLQWIEYAPWESTPDHLQWEVPWAAVILAESLLAARFVSTIRRRI